MIRRPSKLFYFIHFYPTTALLALCAIMLGSCYGKFVMSDKELQAYYQTHHPKPSFHHYDTMGRSIFYAHSGNHDLPLLIFLHGAPGRWYGYIDYLSDSFLLQHFQMISVDRPGYGYSGEGIAETSISCQAEYLQPIIERFSHVPIILIGRSYGGPIASFITAMNQSKVKALLLISNAADPRLEKFWWFSKPVQSKLGKLLLRKSINVSSDEKFSHQNELQQMLPRWQQITQPTIVLQGGKDIIINPYNGKFTDSMLVNAPHEYIFLPKNGHLISNESPRLIKECLMELLLNISKG